MSEAAAGVRETLREIPHSGKIALVGAFVNQFGAFVQLFLVLYLTHRGFSKEQAGLALGAYAVGAIVGTLFGGVVSDRLGPRLTIVVSMYATAVFTAALTVLPIFSAILATVILSGVMTQAARPAVSALLFGLVSEQRQTMVFAMYSTAINAGAIAGPLMAVYLSTVSWNLVFWFDAATSLIYGAVVMLLVPPGTGVADEPEEHTAPNGFRTLVRDGRYLAYLSLMLANGLVHIQYYVVLPLMLVAAGYPTWAYGLTTTVATIIVVGAGVLVTTSTQKWAPWIAVITGWTLLVMGRGGYGLPGGLTIVILATACAAVGQVIGGPAAFAFPARAAPPGAMGRYIGAAHAMFQSGYALGPIIGVLLWTHLGARFWLICFLFGMIMILPGSWGMRSPAVAAKIAAAEAHAATADTTTADVADATAVDVAGTPVVDAQTPPDAARIEAAVEAIEEAPATADLTAMPEPPIAEAPPTDNGSPRSKGRAAHHS
jgi:MFS family permease